MREQLGLRLLAEVMGWETERTTREFDWLRLMARFKFDDYKDFVAGSRFIESLVKWLRQFAAPDRETAYEFVKRRLVFIGDAEMLRLIEAFFPQIVYYDLIDAAAKDMSVADHEVLRSESGQLRFDRLLKSTLFLALSDGARIDVLRRSNYGLIENDQVLVNAYLDGAKWLALRDDLRRKTEEGRSYEHLYLIDDFTASGTTLCRKTSGWKGKLPSFFESVKRSRLVEEGVLSPYWQLHVHHLIATSQAAAEAALREAQAREERGSDWFPSAPRFTYGLVLPSDLSLSDERDSPFLILSDKHYNPDLVTTHTLESGLNHLRRGYGGVALPLVLVHNTPNNSMPLVWAEIDGSDNGPAIVPLFRRIQRYG